MKRLDGRCVSRHFRVLLTCVCGVGMAAPALAQSRHGFDIPAQNVADAFEVFARQSGRQVLFPYDTVAGKNTVAIKGIFDDELILKKLLVAGGLVVVSNNGKTITLRKAGAATPVQTVSEEETAEIIVTARRRSEDASKTPVAVSAVNGRQLREAGVNSAIQLQYLVSGLIVSHDKQGVNISIRGVTTTDVTTKGEPGINVNTDGIPVSRSEEQALGFFDLQRVEILSGPQGTLYGKSSTGGAINIITNPPVPHFEASASVELGNYKTRRAGGMINLPVSDKIAMRFAFDANSHEGFVGLVSSDGKVVGRANDQSTVTGRVSVLARPMDGMIARLTITGGTVGGIGYGNNGVALDIDDTYSGQGTTTGFANRYSGSVEDRFTKANVQVDKDVGTSRLTYLGAHDHYRTRNLTPDYEYGSDGQRLLIRDSYEADYHEFRLSNNADGKLEYVTGLNYFHELIRENGHFWVSGNESLAGIGYDPNYLNIIGLLNHTTHTTYSAYAHASYAITSKFYVSGGLRSSLDNTSRTGTFANGPFAGFSPAGPTPWLNLQGTVCTGEDDCVGTPNNGTSRSTKTTWDIGLNYQMTQVQLFYATIATGYKPGGFNDYDPAVGHAVEYAPENMTAYEAGYKIRLPGRLIFNSSLYYYDYSQSQITQLMQLNNNPNNRISYTQLAPVRMNGWDNDLVLSFSGEDTLRLTANYESAHFGRFFTGPTLSMDFTGRPIDKVPEWVVGASYDHIWRLGSGTTVKFHVDTRHSDSYYVTDFFNGRQYRQIPFWRSASSLTYVPRDGLYTVQAFIANIENQVQITGGAANYIPGVRLSAGGAISEPRTMGVRLTRNF